MAVPSDENSVYINNVEVYRPFLVRSGQQEGLSVINPYMVDKIGFSTGGYGAKYGDKMSSALDITLQDAESQGQEACGGRKPSCQPAGYRCLYRNRNPEAVMAQQREIQDHLLPPRFAGDKREKNTSRIILTIRPI